MPQSLSSVYLHLVFSTKNRIPLIGPESRSRLWAYLGGICTGLHCTPVQIGGTADHVHAQPSFSARDLPLDARGCGVLRSQFGRKRLLR